MSSDASAFGFGKFIPGFDFLQGLTRGGNGSAVPPMSSWVAPTVSVEEIEKRISELKAVQFWLEQNSRALTATVQALEVQKMTLSTLQGMNVSMTDLSKVFTGHVAGAAEAAAGNTGWPMNEQKAEKPKKAAAPKAEAEPEPAKAEAEPAAKPGKDAGAGAAGMGDPMLWWGALSQQFQHIAAQALQDPAQKEAMAKATHMATDFTKAAMQAASSIVKPVSESVKKAAAAATSAAKKPAAKAASATRAAKPATKSAAKPAAKKTAAKTAKPAAARGSRS